jgi:superfamily II DNA/RNA helicase
VKRLGHELKKAGLNAEAFHSDLEQQEREQILLKFRSKQLAILVGTDILSRGIDVEGISLVVNYDTPNDAEDYVHRIGRTARAETTGTAITFVNDKDVRKFASIERLIGKEIVKLTLPSELGEAPNFQVDAKPERTNRKPFRRGGNQNRVARK